MFTKSLTQFNIHAADEGYGNDTYTEIEGDFEDVWEQLDAEEAEQDR